MALVLQSLAGAIVPVCAMPPASDGNPASGLNSSASCTCCCRFRADKAVDRCPISDDGSSGCGCAAQKQENAPRAPAPSPPTKLDRLGGALAILPAPLAALIAKRASAAFQSRPANSPRSDSPPSIHSVLCIWLT